MSKKKFDIKSKTPLIISCLIGIVIGLLVGVLIMNIITKKNNADSNTSNPTVNTDNSNITTYLYEHEILTGSELEKACDDITNKITAIQNDNSYFQIQVGENEFDTYIYNKAGECFAQSSSGAYTAITTSDKNSIKLDLSTSTLAVEQDLDVLSLMKNVVAVAKKDSDNVDFYKMLMEDESGAVEYRIDMIGADAFKEPYAMFNEELANTMFENVSYQMGEGWEPHFIYSFILTEDNLTMCCYIIDEGSEFINWYSQGYVTLGDWKLPEEWYSTDFATESFTNVYSMTELVLADLEKIIEQYALDNGLVTQEEIDAVKAELESSQSETETTTEDSEEETTESTEETVEE